MFYDDDADLTLLDGKTVAIIGFGSQGHAHAQNLRDSGVDVVVGLREGSSSVQAAQDAGLEVLPVADAASRGDIVMVLVPDELHHDVWEQEVARRHRPRQPRCSSATASRSTTARSSRPPTSTSRSSPPRAPATSSAASTPRAPACPASSRSSRTRPGTPRRSRSPTPSGIGCTRGGVIETTFKDETETDLFGEQAVLCGGATALVQAGFETLVEAGYDPQMAYFECLHELKLIVDLMYEKGMAGMRYSISNTAEYGDYTRGPRVVDDHARAEMKRILGEIQSGEFAREWIAENRAGQENFKRLRAEQADTEVEHVGEELRSHMDWIKPSF